VDLTTYRLAIIAGRMEWKCTPCTLQESANNSDLPVPAAESTLGKYMSSNLEKKIITRITINLETNVPFSLGSPGTRSMLSLASDPSAAQVDQNDSEMPTHDPVPLPNVIHEESIDDPTPMDIDPEPVAPVTYQIVEGGTKRRREKLIDSVGYGYNFKERTKTTKYWQCTVCPKGNPCRATVKETTTGVYAAGRQSNIVVVVLLI
jgi:hypothetical protein